MKAVIFDFGNVVGFFDHQITLGKLACHTDMPPAEMYQAVYLGQLEDAFESGRMTKAQFLQEARRLCRLTCDQAIMETAFADIFVPNPEVCSLIPRLKGKYQIILGSNTNELHAAKFLDQFAEVLGMFDHLVLSYQIQTRKPLAGFFEHCRRLANCSAEECLFIDDLPANVEGARAAGLKGLLYQPGNQLTRQLASLGISV